MSTAESWTVGRLLQWTADYLAGHGSDSSRLDAEVLLAHAIGCQRIELYTAFDEQPADNTRSTFRNLVRRRAEGTPVAYLVGRREFYSLSFRVTPDVLIPRPETELLVVAALDLAKAEGQQRQGSRETGRQGDSAADHDSPGFPSPLEIADVGTGSGVIAVCLAKHLPACRVTAIDISVRRWPWLRKTPRRTAWPTGSSSLRAIYLNESGVRGQRSGVRGQDKTEP